MVTYIRLCMAGNVLWTGRLVWEASTLLLVNQLPAEGLGCEGSAACWLCGAETRYSSRHVWLGASLGQSGGGRGDFCSKGHCQVDGSAQQHPRLKKGLSAFTTPG